MSRSRIMISPLSDVISKSFDGAWGPESTLSDGGTPVLRSTDMRGGTLTFDNVAIRLVPEKSILKKRLIPGDILVNKSSGSSHLVGLSVLFMGGPDSHPYLCSNFVRCLRPDSSNIDPEYLYHFLCSPQFRNQVFGAQRTTSGLRNLNVKEYLSAEISYPASIDQQKAIVRRIKSLLRYASELEDVHSRALEHVQSLPAVMLRQVLDGEL